MNDREKNTGSPSKMARNIETRLAESLLRWRYRKKGMAPPSDESLKSQSKAVAEEVHEIVKRRGKNILKEFISGREKQ